MEKTIRNDEHRDTSTQMEDLYIDESWHTNSPAKAERTDLQAPFQEPTNSTANYSEHYNDYNKLTSSLMNSGIEKEKLDIFDISSRYKNTSETAIIEFPTTTSEATLESAAKLGGEVDLWWIESPPDAEEGGLCNICRHISFGAILHKTDGLIQDSFVPLGTLQAIMQKTECSFCRLVAHTGSQILQGTTESLGSHGNNAYCELCGDIRWNRSVRRIRIFCLKLTISLPSELGQVIRYGNIQQILTSGEHPPEQSLNDSRIVKDQVDLELIKRWLETCKEHHNSTYLEYNGFHGTLNHETPTDIHDRSTIITQPCQPTPINTATLELTLVDVRRECLVDMPLNTTYIALSYVCGGSQPFQNVIRRKKDLYSPHSISADDEAIPRTIQDAIRLAANLGEKYLWVDSLCICQDDMEDRMNQIMNMGNIYSRAHFTIVAASGSNAHAGLPGVRAFSRNSAQRTEYVQGMLLANELPQLEDIIEQSCWNSRAWTFQERQLCNRHLIFSRTHVFFLCNRTVFKEDSGLRNHIIIGMGGRRIRAKRQPSWNSYRRAVVEYTKRAISDESDAINAFQGIASLLQPAFKGDFLFGLPETEFDIALLWQPISEVRRRVNPETNAPLFPSWSWAGWIGEVMYQWTRHQLDDLSRVEWQCMDSTEGNIRFCTSNELRAPKYGVDHDRWELMPDDRGTPCYYQRNNPDIWCLHPVAPKDERRNHLLIQAGSHHLTFRANTAFFRISSKCSAFPSDPFGEDIHFLCPRTIFDRDGFAAGKVSMPAALIKTLKGDYYQEFVCLSRRRWGIMDDGPAPDSPEDDFKDIPDKVTLYPYNNCSAAIDSEFDQRRYNMDKPWRLYNVMMIGRDNDGVASRIALGTMHVTAFVQAKPVLKVITLA